jgi:hypothetical protein
VWVCSERAKVCERGREECEKNKRRGKLAVKLDVGIAGVKHLPNLKYEA